MNHTEPKCAEIIYLIFPADTNKMRRIGICTEALNLGKLIYATKLNYIEKKIFSFQV